MFVSKDQKFDKNLIPPARLFSEYFGGGLSSIVFQEIRESRGLAYAAFAAYSLPSKPDKSNYTYAFVGTQADKLKEATDEMLNLMNDMPKAEKQFDLANILKDELEELGLEEVVVNQWGYVLATLPTNQNKDVPTITLIGHLDTSPAVSGKNVKPQIHENFDGSDIVLSAEEDYVLKVD